MSHPRSPLPCPTLTHGHQSTTIQIPTTFLPPCCCVLLRPRHCRQCWARFTRAIDSVSLSSATALLTGDRLMILLFVAQHTSPHHLQSSWCPPSSSSSSWMAPALPCFVASEPDADELRPSPLPLSFDDVPLSCHCFSLLCDFSIWKHFFIICWIYQIPQSLARSFMLSFFFLVSPATDAMRLPDVVLVLFVTWISGRPPWVHVCLHRNFVHFFGQVCLPNQCCF